jgi:hypothetical protein
MNYQMPERILINWSTDKYSKNKVTCAHLITRKQEKIIQVTHVKKGLHIKENLTF